MWYLYLQHAIQLHTALPSKDTSWADAGRSASPELKPENIFPGMSPITAPAPESQHPPGTGAAAPASPMAPSCPTSFCHTGITNKHVCKRKMQAIRDGFLHSRDTTGGRQGRPEKPPQIPFSISMLGDRLWSGRRRKALTQANTRMGRGRPKRFPNGCERISRTGRWLPSGISFQGAKQQRRILGGDAPSLECRRRPPSPSGIFNCPALFAALAQTFVPVCHCW